LDPDSDPKLLKTDIQIRNWKCKKEQYPGYRSRDTSSLNSVSRIGNSLKEIFSWISRFPWSLCRNLRKFWWSNWR